MPQIEQTNVSTRANKSRLAALALGLLVLCLAFFFQTRSFTNVGTPEAPVPHWGVLLNALFNENFVKEIWFGVDLPSAEISGERLTALGLGAFAIAALFFVGRFLISPFRKLLELNNAEVWFFAGALGVVFLSFALQIAGLTGHANLPLFLPLTAIFVIGLGRLLVRFLSARSKSEKQSAEAKRVQKRFASLGRFDQAVLVLQILLAVLFTVFYLCASTQPLFEYDALEYHAQGAREIFESGRIAFSPNNVYVNMPLGAELFYVAGLDIARDVSFHGADVLRIGLLIGKTILVGTALLTAFGAFCFGARFLRGKRSGLWCAIIFLSFPNLFEVYSNGLNDALLGLTLFMEPYLLLRLFGTQRSLTGRELLVGAILPGVIAGFAASIKYTGVVFVSAPAFLAFAILLVSSRTRGFLTKIADDNVSVDGEASGDELQSHPAIKASIIAGALVFFLTAAICVGGGWYFKNITASGNPVYPLCYGVFGDSTNCWNDSINERWSKAHSSSEYGFHAFSDAIQRSLWHDDFNSPFFIFVPLAILGALCGLRRVQSPASEKERSGARNRQPLLILVGLLIVLFWILWFFATHRLTRFLLPVAPLTALLVGAGVFQTLNSSSRTLRGCVLATTLFSLLYSGLLIDMLGQGRLAPLKALEQDSARFPAAALYFNSHPELFASAEKDGSDNKLLLIGEARACAYRVPVVYSTCWNDSPLMKTLESGVKRDETGTIAEITDPFPIRQALRQEGIAYVYVDFGELARFRSEGNYGFNNPEITPELFILLVNANVLDPIAPEDMSDQSSTAQIFKVLP